MSDLKTSETPLETATPNALSGKYYAAVGRRKSASAQVRLYSAEATSGQKAGMVVNNRDYKKYFPTFELQRNVELPLKVAGLSDEFFVSVLVQGGGVNGQADSVKLGIARALLKYNPDLKAALKPHDLLTRDPREKERKKPGLKRARRAPQWQKR